MGNACRHYEEFIASVKELLEVRSKASRLQEMIADYHVELVEATAPHVQAIEKLIEMRKVRSSFFVCFVYFSSQMSQSKDCHQPALQCNSAVT